MKLKKISGKLSGLLALAAILASLGSASYAAWRISSAAVNILTVDSMKNIITEQYVPPDHVNPSQEVEKIVNVKNTGTMDTLIRLSVETLIGREKEDGSFETDPDLNPEMVEILYNDEEWIHDDNYHYYKSVLHSGEETSQPLMRGYRLREEAGNEYQGKDVRILVMLESVQADVAAAQKVWECSFEELGMQIDSSLKVEDSSVSWMGKDQGFAFSDEATDLFRNFKSLTPGCARTQLITLKNQSDQKVEIYLRAEAVSQNKMSEQELEKVLALLAVYGKIEISQGDRNIYTGPIQGNIDNKAGEASLKKDISLGKLKAGQDKELTVKLRISPLMPDDYQELTGKVKWVFTAAGTDSSASASGSSGSTASVRTGDDSDIDRMLILMGASLLFLTAAWRKVRKKSV